MKGPLFSGEPAYSGALQRALGTDGQGFGFVDPTVQPVVVAADFDKHEYRWLRRWRTFAAGNNTPAAAGRNSGAILRPRGSNVLENVLVMVRRIIISQPNPGAVQGISFGLFYPGLAPATANDVPLTGQSRDSRCTQQSLCELNLCTTLVSQQAGDYMLLPAAALPRVIPCEFCFTNNSAGFFITTSVANQQFNVAVEWEERYADRIEVSTI